MIFIKNVVNALIMEKINKSKISQIIRNFLLESYESKDAVDTESEIEINKTKKGLPQFEEYMIFSIDEERRVLPFTMKYAMIGGHLPSFQKDIEELYKELKTNGYTPSDIIDLLFPKLKGLLNDESTFEEFFSLLTPYHKQTKASEDDVFYYDDPQNKKLEVVADNLLSFVGTSGEKKISIKPLLTKTGYAQLQFLARVATDNFDLTSRPDEFIFYASNRKDSTYRKRAHDTLMGFYRKAIREIALRLTGRNRESFEMNAASIKDDFDPEFKNLLDAGMTSLSDAMFQGKYDASYNNFGAWAFTIIKNGIKLAIRKYTKLGFNLGYDPKLMRSPADAFEQNPGGQYSIWVSKLPLESSNIDIGDLIIPENINVTARDGEIKKLPNLNNIPQPVYEDGTPVLEQETDTSKFDKKIFYEYVFKSGLIAHSYLEEAAKDNVISIFNTLSKHSLQKLKNLDAYKSSRKDVDYGYLNPTQDEPIDLDQPTDQGKKYNVTPNQKDQLHIKLIDTVINNIDRSWPSFDKKPALKIFSSGAAKKAYAPLIQWALDNEYSEKDIEDIYKSCLGEAFFSIWSEPVYDGPVWTARPSTDFLKKLEQLYDLQKGTLVNVAKKISTSSNINKRPIIVQDEFYFTDEAGEKKLMPELDQYSYDNIGAVWSSVPGDKALAKIEKKYSLSGLKEKIQGIRTSIDNSFYIIKEGNKRIIPELDAYIMNIGKPLIKFATSQRNKLDIEVAEAIRKYNSNQIEKLGNEQLAFLFDAGGYYSQEARQYGSMNVFKRLATLVSAMRFQGEHGENQSLKVGSMLNPETRTQTLDKISKIISLLSGTDITLEENIKKLRNLIKENLLRLYKK